MPLMTNQFYISNFSIFISPQSLMMATFLTNGSEAECAASAASSRHVSQMRRTPGRVAVLLHPAHPAPIVFYDMHD